MTLPNEDPPGESLVQLAGKRIFVVEDDAAVSMILEDNLAELGLKVVATASRLDEATEKADSVEFDVAILDVSLNGQNTFALATGLAEKGKSFVFSTGYGAEGLPGRYRGVPILQKPYELNDLQRAIWQALR